MERIAINPPDVICIDERLELRPLVPGHAAELYALVEANRERLGEWMPWLGVHYSVADMRQYAVDRAADNLNRTSLTSTIWLEGKICGAISLHRIDQRHRSSSIGYWLTQDVEGQGVMTRACAALIDAAFNRYGLHRLEVRCATGNLRSKAIPRRLGFTEEGLLRHAEWLHDRWVDLRVFSMLAEEWNIPGAEQGQVKTFY